MVLAGDDVTSAKLQFPDCVDGAFIGKLLVEFVDDGFEVVVDAADFISLVVHILL